MKLVRGPFLRLAPHRHHTEDEKRFLAWTAKLRDRGARLAADLFSGAGGLSLGLEAAGWKVVLSADHFSEAVETHRHHFGGMALDWDLADPDRVDKIAQLVRDAGVELLAGGPPCQPFSKAGRSKIRHRVREHLRDPHDERRELWRSFVEVVRQARPRAVLMENVPDMALDREMFILRDMVHELEEMGYAVEERVVETFRYGVPQFRQRLILVGLSGNVSFGWPKMTEKRTTVWNAIGDLPPVEGGWRPEGGALGYIKYGGPQSTFQKKMRQGVRASDRDKVFDHITRPVREDDREIFDMMDASTRYSDLPEEMRRYRADIFDDKYKRLDANDLSRTIVAHIAKDGYGFIHPHQPRTLTVREAARLQTFPDWFRFAGPPSFAFKQIGNAVPPLLGEHLGKAIMSSLDLGKTVSHTTTEVGRLLARWFDGTQLTAVPWLKADTRWQVISSELMLDRAPAEHIRLLWPLLRRWATPEQTLAAADEVTEIAKWLGRQSKALALLATAERFEDDPSALEEDDKARASWGLNTTVVDLAILAVPVKDQDNAEQPVIVGKGVARVAARFTGDPVNRRNILTDGRLAVARMIGYGTEARSAHLALVEIANSVCRPEVSHCFACPLAKLCHDAQMGEAPSDDGDFF
ncbi:DNA (cytosine-5-)-methyltransferase [Hamadaea sp. NPDC050747]|uniref:DNA cytosine methyltransferase n=1 Tax=Hamadaea sp. NPDC050747 TaxID=3155789 RepID=UPI0033CAA189